MIIKKHLFKMYSMTINLYWLRVTVLIKSDNQIKQQSYNKKDKSQSRVRV